MDGQDSPSIMERPSIETFQDGCIEGKKDTNTKMIAEYGCEMDGNSGMCEPEEFLYQALWVVHSHGSRKYTGQLAPP